VRKPLARRRRRWDRAAAVDAKLGNEDGKQRLGLLALAGRDDVVEGVGDGAQRDLIWRAWRVGYEITGECLISVVQCIQACPERRQALVEGDA
jgi:hypothetical protein